MNEKGTQESGEPAAQGAVSTGPAQSHAASARRVQHGTHRNTLWTLVSLLCLGWVGVAVGLVVFPRSLANAVPIMWMGALTAAPAAGLLLAWRWNAGAQRGVPFRGWRWIVVLGLAAAVAVAANVSGPWSNLRTTDAKVLAAVSATLDLAGVGVFILACWLVFRRRSEDGRPVHRRSRALFAASVTTALAVLCFDAFWFLVFIAVESLRNLPALD